MENNQVFLLLILKVFFFTEYVYLSTTEDLVTMEKDSFELRTVAWKLNYLDSEKFNYFVALIFKSKVVEVTFNRTNLGRILFISTYKQMAMGIKFFCNLKNVLLIE